MPSFRGRGGRGRGRGGRNDFRNDFNEDTEWSRKVRDNRDEQKLDLEFSDYDGEKKHELPEDFVKMLNADKTEARSENFMLESDFGITEYVTADSAGFSGILKHRFTDFVVHEISPNGEAVKLTDLSLPPDLTKEKEVLANFSEYNQIDDADKALVSALSWTRLLQLAKKCAEATKEKGATEHGEVRIDVTTKSKDERKLYHDIIKRHFPHLDSGTISVEDKKFVVVSAHKKPKFSNEWPRDRPKHLTFHLCKEGMDTVHIFGQLARELGQHNSKFGVAGTKDKRSISTQKVCIRFVTAEKLCRAVKTIRSYSGQRVNIGNFSYEKDDLDLGDLKGNKFTIVLRNVAESKETIEKSVSGLKNNGFINYFGQQRFGTDGYIKTSDIGLALIKSDWMKAVELILRPRGNESVQMTRMRAHWWIFRNPGDAVVLLGSRISQSKAIESVLLQGLAKHKDGNFEAGLSHLQRNTKLLYLHAYQSMVWNKAVSQRIKKFGFQVLVGDMVLMPEENKAEDDGQTVEIPKADENASKRELKEARIVKITEENLDQFTIADVVMPIPGCKVSYPDHDELKKIYIELLQADGLEDGFESLKHSNEFYSLPGDYRSILVTPSDVSWKFTCYDDPNKDILVSDMALLEGQLPVFTDVGKYMAVIVELTLPSSTYATMALREAMKIDMNKGSQAKLTEIMNESILAQKRKIENENGNGDVESGEAKKAKIVQDDE